MELLYLQRLANKSVLILSDTGAHKQHVSISTVIKCYSVDYSDLAIFTTQHSCGLLKLIIAAV